MSTQLVDDFEQFFRTYYDDRENENTPILELAQRYPGEQQSLVIDYDDLYRFNPDLAEDVLNEPDQILEYAEEALRQYDIPIDVELDANVRLDNLDALPEDYTFDVGEYTVNYESKLVGVQGQVNKVDYSKGKIGEAAFECHLCGTITRIEQHGEFQEPHECHGCERQAPFSVDWQQSELEDFQLIRMQLPPEKAHRGGQSSTIDLRLEGKDLVDRVSPGDRITAATKLTAEIDDEDMGTFVLTGEANNLEHQETDYEDLDLDEYEDEIRDLANSANPHQKIIDSIKPTHQGDENIKEAIALQMFGGVEKELPDGSTIRGNSHMLLVVRARPRLG